MFGGQLIDNPSITITKGKQIIGKNEQVIVSFSSMHSPIAKLV